MNKEIKTSHSEYKNFFYFLLPEKIAVVVLFVAVTLLTLFLYLLFEYIYSGEVPLKVKAMLIVFGLFGYCILLFSLVPAYYRGNFLRKNGYCIVKDDYIESVCSGNRKRYEYVGRSIKTKKYKDGSADIFIGKSFIDMVKHGSFVFTPKFFRAYLSAIGAGIPLYRVTNADEVMSYLDSNK